MTTPPTRSNGYQPGRRIPRDEPVFVISVAAELVGAHPQTLRSYERAGLVVPARTEGGTRRYSPADIDRLRHIQQLTNEGLTLAGVARVLELERRLAEMSRPSTALVPRNQSPIARRHAARRPTRTLRSATSRSTTTSQENRS